MITKNQTKCLYYLDRDTDIIKLVDEMMRVKRAEALVFLQKHKDRLQEKEAGEYFTAEDTLKLKEGELENMNRFFRGAVVPYYVRQKYDVWTPTIPSSIIKQGTEEIKRAVGFLKYDSSGHLTDEVNSLSTFDRVKDLNLFLTSIEEVCFDDEALIFPDSAYFKELVARKGRVAAQRQVCLELHEKIKNKFPNRKIIK